MSEFLCFANRSFAVQLELQDFVFHAKYSKDKVEKPLILNNIKLCYIFYWYMPNSIFFLFSNRIYNLWKLRVQSNLHFSFKILSMFKDSTFLLYTSSSSLVPNILQTPSISFVVSKSVCCWRVISLLQGIILSTFHSLLFLFVSICFAFAVARCFVLPIYRLAAPVLGVATAPTPHTPPWHPSLAPPLLVIPPQSVVKNFKCRKTL